VAVATITLESATGDSVVVSAPNDAYLNDDIILDTSPDGLYDAGFTVRTKSGAFEPGGRIVGESIPIREMVLPFWLTPASRPRFQKLWGTPGNFKKVKWHYDGPSGRRTLTLRLAKEIKYTTEDGFDAQVDSVYHAVVSAMAVNPMFESHEDVAEWVNPGNFTIHLAALSGTFTLGYAGQLTGPIPWNAPAATVQAELGKLSTLGAGNATVSGNPGNWTVKTPVTVPGSLTIDGALLSPLDISITTFNLLNKYSINVNGQITKPLAFSASATAIKEALEGLSRIGTGGVTVTPTLFGHSLSFVNGTLKGSTVALFTSQSQAVVPVARLVSNPNTGWFDVWNPTDQPLWLEWTFDPADEWQFPDFGFGQEKLWGRKVGQDAARLIITPKLTQMLSVMSDPFMDTYVSADLSNAAGLFNGVEPIYAVPPYTSTDKTPTLVPVTCRGPAGAKATLRQRRFWSAESGLEA